MTDKDPKEKDKKADDKLEKIKRNMKKEDILEDDAPLSEEAIAREQERLAQEEAQKQLAEINTALSDEVEEQETDSRPDDGFMQVTQEKKDASEDTAPEEAESFKVADKQTFAQDTGVQENAAIYEDDEIITPEMFNENASMFSASEDDEVPDFPSENKDKTIDKETDENEALQNAMAFAQASLAQSGEWKDPFEEIEESIAVKKYIIYINKDFIEKLDAMDTDTRNAYVNESLQLKKDTERGVIKRRAVEKTFKHVVAAFATIIIGTPIVFFLINKSIDLTLANYDYVQKNFEVLYKQRADRSKAIQRANVNLNK